MRAVRLALFLAGLVSLAAALVPPPSAAALPRGFNRINHVVVIYMENWSFDGLLGLFPGANGINQAPLRTKIQTTLTGQPFATLPQDPEPCMPAGLPNGPFDLAPFFPPDQTCPSNVTHRYYQAIYEVNNGLNNRFVAWGAGDVPPVPSGLSMSYYDATTMSLGQLASEFTLCDMTFCSGLGGSWYNHMWLVAARPPSDPHPQPSLKAVFRNGLLVRDGEFTPDNVAINDIDPNQITSQTYPTVGDRLTARGISWKWYQGGWNQFVQDPNNAPEYDIQHSPYLYFGRYQSYKVPGTPGNLHLADDTDFLADLQNNSLPTVSWVKPDNKRSMHPGEGSVTEGMDYIQQYVDAVRNSPYWNDCVVFITFDENGGRWDHVAPPKVDRWGPGNRVPMVVVSPFAKRGFVDHTVQESLSTTKFMEVRFNLPPLAYRDRYLTTYFQNCFE